MRVFASCVALALCAACSQPAPPAPPASSVASDDLDPANVMRGRAELPAGYEVAELPGRASPLAGWGFGAQWTADPPQCGALAEPSAADAPVRGWSASGPGGIVYSVVAPGAGLDPVLVDECGTWTVAAGHTSALVTAIPAPVLEGAATVGMTADVTTTVEGGTETHSRAITFNAYLSGYVASVTVVTDPGAVGPGLGPDFAATLFVNTVSVLRAR